MAPRRAPNVITPQQLKAKCEVEIGKENEVTTIIDKWIWEV
jgi:hypothetical protein